MWKELTSDGVDEGVRASIDRVMHADNPMSVLRYVMIVH